MILFVLVLILAAIALIHNLTKSSDNPPETGPDTAAETVRYGD